MNYVRYVYRWWGRELRKIINAILKSWLAQEIQKLNYIQSFCLNDKNVEKSEIKILLISTDNKEKLSAFLSKNFSQIEELNIN